MTGLAKNDPVVLSATAAVRQMFWAKVEKTETCWLWQGPVTAFGHGRYWIKRTLVSAHRIAKLWETGEPQLNKIACHSCSTRHCVRPSHLYWGTHADNMRDMVSSGGALHGKTRGELHARSVISDKMAASIWNELIKTPSALTKIAKRCGVARSTVSNIKNRNCYTSVTDKLPRIPALPKASDYPPIIRKRREKLSEVQALQICQMLDDGVGIEAVARFASTCSASIHRIYVQKFGQRPKLRGAKPRTKTFAAISKLLTET